MGDAREVGTPARRRKRERRGGGELGINQSPAAARELNHTTAGAPPHVACVASPSAARGVRGSGSRVATRGREAEAERNHSTGNSHTRPDTGGAA